MVATADEHQVREVVRRPARANGNEMVNLEPSVALALASETAAAVTSAHERAHLSPLGRRHSANGVVG